MSPSTSAPAEVTQTHNYIGANDCRCRTRWDETLKQSSSFADLQRAVKFNGPGSPCVSGCRSICWKVSRGRELAQSWPKLPVEFLHY